MPFVGSTGHFDKVRGPSRFAFTFHVDTIFRYAQDWFEENVGSEVVLWFDVADAHDHSPLPVPLRIC